MEKSASYNFEVDLSSSSKDSNLNEEELNKLVIENKHANTKKCTILGWHKYKNGLKKREIVIDPYTLHKVC